MANNSSQWVIRLETDQVKGPYSTEAIAKMIASGVFSGNEEICIYPEGEWRPLSKQPEFYEALLDSLENPIVVDNKKAQKMDAETVIRTPTAPPASAPKEENDSHQVLDQIKKALEEQIALEEKNRKPVVMKPLPSPVVQKANSSAKNEKEIVLSDIKKIQKKELRKFAPFFLIIVAVIFAAAYVIFSDTQAASPTDGWVLLSPNLKNKNKSSADVQDLKKKAIYYFQKGQLEGIHIAQKILVQGIESQPKDLELIGLLCMAHEQLWPFTKQTVQDLKSISLVTQLARSINPISNYSDSCQSVYLMTKGQVKEARSLIEKTLDNIVDKKFILSPFLYMIKGEILENEQDYINAVAYYDQASKLWQQWIWPKISIGRMNLKMNKFPEARAAFQATLEFDGDSKAALFGLGLVEIKGFKNTEKASQYFTTGFALKQILPKSFHVEALYAYAQILLEKNDQPKALKVAQTGYRINPSHKGLKEMVINLGGDERIENAQNEIVLIGDQFVRANDHLAAVAQYKAAFELDPTNSTAAFKAAKSLWALNQSREAVNWLSKAIKADPKLIQAYVLKADYESQRYNFAEASRILMEAAKRSPQNYEVYKGQALIEFRKNNITGAIQFGEKAVKTYDADVEVLSILAQAYIAQYTNTSAKPEDREKAKKAAERYSGKAIELEPGLPETQITYAKYLSAADGSLRGEQYLNNLIKSFPYTTEYRIALAEHYANEEKFNEASQVYQQIVDIEPKNKKANFGLADCYRLLNKPDLAQRYYNAASIIDPTDVEPLFSNAKLLLETAYGKEAKARILQAADKFNVVQQINPNFPRVYFFLAKCYLELGDFDKAVEYIKEEKTKNPNLADPYLLSAEIFFRKQQFKECAAEYSIAVKMRPSSAELYVKSAICYRKSDAIDIAEDMLSIAKDKEDGYAPIYRERGYIYKRKNMLPEARENFDKYLQISPNAPDRSVVEAEMREVGG